MGVRAADTVRAAVTIRALVVALVPVRALPRAVANRRVPADVEVVVGVDAILPVVLNPDGAPQGLVPVHVEVVRVLTLVLFVGGEQGPPELRPAMHEGALAPALAGAHVREVRAEATLVHRLRVEHGVGARALTPAVAALTFGLLRALGFG